MISGSKIFNLWGSLHLSFCLLIGSLIISHLNYLSLSINSIIFSVHFINYLTFTYFTRKVMHFGGVSWWCASNNNFVVKHNKNVKRNTFFFFFFFFQKREILLINLGLIKKHCQPEQGKRVHLIIRQTKVWNTNSI